MRGWGDKMIEGSTPVAESANSCHLLQAVTVVYVRPLATSDCCCTVLHRFLPPRVHNNIIIHTHKYMYIYYVYC